MARQRKERNNTMFILAGIIIGIVITGFLGSYGDFSRSVSFEDGGGKAMAKIAAVTNAGGGVIGTVDVEIIDGRGRILVTTEPFAEFDTQHSVQVAAKAAERITGKSLANNDILVSFSISGAMAPEIIGGPSAGVSVAAAIVAALENLTVRSDVIMTGTIDENGNIGRVGGILEKARAAADSGINLFIAPKGSGSVEFYKKELSKERQGDFIVQKVDYVPKITSLDEYVEQFGMDALELSNLREALPHVLVEKEIVQEILAYRVAVAGAPTVQKPYNCGFA